MSIPAATRIPPTVVAPATTNIDAIEEALKGIGAPLTM